ncbi:glucosaminidase domain-containing protein [Marinomonas sp. GJ51-6]|uniref:glucosaminidase domain-containing protein n=1 Tax=Marinomonas sp. GJ51-6 TaxID=2992802 RepID=UPI002934CBDA|nr:glucosaminidase domain-containing protein [Marinomonas sp. GJ51-6]WOD06515.1 glucosaminidase domain-containing protein [Marinomonas sp. GJ51-6]
MNNKRLDTSFSIIILILVILGIAISHTSQDNINLVQDDVDESQENVGDELQESDGDASPYEKIYFKSHPVQTQAPDFLNIANIKARKEAFFNYLAPFAHEKNRLNLADRKRITALINTSKKMSAEDKEWVSALRKFHKLKQREEHSKTDLKDLLHRVDIIPVSLVLAQAANESAWGTSRFATEGNNFFGQWCFRKGCGLVPASRNDGADHEVRKFHDARESVFAYIDNLNSNAAYKELRAARATLRQKGKAITGLVLVHGLEHYSERGDAYVEEIEGLISYNKLWRFNKSQPNPKAQ